MDGGLKVITIILGVLVAGFWLGVWATHYNFVRPLWETEAGLRKELKEARAEAWKKDCDLDALRYWAPLAKKHSVAHFDLAAPKIEHRSPSDVFFFNNFEDLL